MSIADAGKYYDRRIKTLQENVGTVQAVRRGGLLFARGSAYNTSTVPVSARHGVYSRVKPAAHLSAVLRSPAPHPCTAGIHSQQRAVDSMPMPPSTSLIRRRCERSRTRS
jgi:hypothetical protein